MQRKRVRTTATTASPITSQKMRMSRSSVGGEEGVSDVAKAEVDGATLGLAEGEPDLEISGGTDGTPGDGV